MATRIRKVSKEMYWCAKMLLNGGAMSKEVAAYLNLSDETVRRIKKSENYEDFEQTNYSYHQGWAIRKSIEAAEAKKAEAEKEAKKAEAEKVAEKVGAVPAARIITIPDPAQQKPVSMTIQATHYMETKLDVIIDLLKVMNNKLGAIIDDLYGTGCKEVKKDDE